MSSRGKKRHHGQVSKANAQLAQSPFNIYAWSGSQSSHVTKTDAPFQGATGHASVFGQDSVRMAKYQVIPMSILSSAKMKDRVRLIRQRINPMNLTEDKKRTPVVALRAKLAVAGKMISIVEIVKKDIRETGGQWWQYSTLGGPIQKASAEDGATTSPMPARNSDWAKTPSHRRDDADKSRGRPMDKATFEQEEAFETMPPLDSTSAREGSLGMRNGAHMIVYLASVPIPELKELYGEQTNS